MMLAVRACVDSYWSDRRSPESVEALRDLEKALETEVNSEELLKKVRSLLKATQALRNEVEASR